MRNPIGLRAYLRSCAREEPKPRAVVCLRILKWSNARSIAPSTDGFSSWYLCKVRKAWGLRRATLNWHLWIAEPSYRGKDEPWSLCPDCRDLLSAMSQSTSGYHAAIFLVDANGRERSYP